MRSEGFKGSFVTGLVLSCCLEGGSVRSEARVDDGSCALEPWNDIHQLKHIARPIIISGAYWVIERLEGK